MMLARLRARLDPELVDWLRTEINLGDAPELHHVGLELGDLVRCFDAIDAAGASGSSASGVLVELLRRLGMAFVVVRREEQD